MLLQRQSLLIALPLLFFFNDTATTEIYTLSLHDALPISIVMRRKAPPRPRLRDAPASRAPARIRSEEHTSELQSHLNLVCPLLLGKKNRPACMIRSQEQSSFPAASIPPSPDIRANDASSP